MSTGLPGQRLKGRIPERGRGRRGWVADLPVNAVTVGAVVEHPDAATQHHALIARQQIGPAKSRSDDKPRPRVVFLRNALTVLQDAVRGNTGPRYDGGDGRRAAG